MIFKYTESGTIDLNGQTVDSTIDTEGTEYRERAEWIARKAGVRYLGTEITAALSPGDLTTNFTGTARFQFGDEPTIGVDALAVRYSPITGLASVVAVYGLKVAIVDYQPQPPPEPPKDWEQPGARIGPPLPGMPGRFSSRNDGGKAGDRWTGASGKVYRLENTVVAFGVSIWAWVPLA